MREDDDELQDLHDSRGRRLGRTLGPAARRQGMGTARITCKTLRSARQGPASSAAASRPLQRPRAAQGNLVLIATPRQRHSHGGSRAGGGTSVVRAGGSWRIPAARSPPPPSSCWPAPAPARRAPACQCRPTRVRAFRVSRGRPRDRGDAGGGAAAAADAGIRRGAGDIPRQAKVLYHLIACLMSNDLVALLSLALETWPGLAAREAARLYLRWCVARSRTSPTSAPSRR